jgi:hypothetical protein
MQIWKGVLGWDSLFSWASVGTIFALLVGVGLSLMSIDWVPHNLLLAQSCFCLALLILAAKLVRHAAVSKDAWWHRMLFSFILCGIVGVSATEIVRFLELEKTKREDHRSIAQKQANPAASSLPEPVPATQETAIFMESQMFSLPISIPPGGTARVIPLSKRRIEANKWGFVAVSGDADNGRWPNKKALERSKQLHNAGVFAYRCRVTNRGSQTIIYLGIPISIWFGQDGGEANKKQYIAILGGLGPGEALEFYLVNDCNVMVNAIWQEAATVKILGEARQRQIPLRRMFMSPIDQIMMFFPTSVRWIDGESCE